MEKGVLIAEGQYELIAHVNLRDHEGEWPTHIYEDHQYGMNPKIRAIIAESELRPVAEVQRDTCKVLLTCKEPVVLTPETLAAIVGLFAPSDMAQHRTGPKRDRFASHIAHVWAIMWGVEAAKSDVLRGVAKRVDAMLGIDPKRLKRIKRDHRAYIERIKQISLAQEQKRLASKS